MAKLTLNPNPTFQKNVAIPVQGKGSANVTFTFKHYPRSELLKRLEVSESSDINDDEYLMQFVEGWDLDDKFNKENLSQMLNNYLGSAKAIMDTYSSEMFGIKEKN